MEETLRRIGKLAKAILDIVALALEHKPVEVPEVAVEIAKEAAGLAASLHWEQADRQAGGAEGPHTIQTHRRDATHTLGAAERGPVEQEHREVHQVQRDTGASEKQESKKSMRMELPKKKTAKKTKEEKKGECPLCETFGPLCDSFKDPVKRQKCWGLLAKLALNEIDADTFAEEMLKIDKEHVINWLKEKGLL